MVISEIQKRRKRPAQHHLLKIQLEITGEIGVRNKEMRGDPNPVFDTAQDHYAHG